MMLNQKDYHLKIRHQNLLLNLNIGFQLFRICQMENLFMCSIPDHLREWIFTMGDLHMVLGENF